MCLTPSRGSTPTTSKQGPDTHGNREARQSVTINGNPAASTGASSRATSNDHFTTSSSSSSSSSSSGSSISTVTTSSRKTSLTGTTHKLKGSLTSSLASKFGGNAVIFPKLGVGGGSLGQSPALKKFESVTSSASTKLEFASVKLKKVSKVTEDKISKTPDTSVKSVEIETKSVTEINCNNGLTHLNKRDITCESEKKGSVAETVNAVAAAAVSTPVISAISTNDSSNSSFQESSTSFTNKSISSSTLNTSRKIDSYETACGISGTEVSSTISSLSSVNKQTSSTSTASSSRSFSVDSKCQISTIIGSSSSSHQTRTSSHSTNVLCRSATIKNSDIPAIACKTIDSAKGDTDVKFITTVKKVKKSVDGSVKKKKKNVAIGVSDNKEVVIDEKHDTVVSDDVNVKTCDKIVGISLAVHDTGEDKTNIEKAFVSGSCNSTSENKDGNQNDVIVTFVVDNKRKQEKCVEKQVQLSVNETVAVVEDSLASLKTFSAEKQKQPTMSKKATEVRPVMSASSPGENQMPVSAPLSSGACSSDKESTQSGELHSTVTAPPISAMCRDATEEAAAVAGFCTRDANLSLSSTVINSSATKSTSLSQADVRTGAKSKTGPAVHQSLKTGTDDSIEIPSNVCSSADIGTDVAQALAGPSSLLFSAAVTSVTAAAVLPSLSSSPSVCSLSTATDTLSTSISTSTSDLSISPPASATPCSSGSGGGGVAAVALSTSILTNTGASSGSTTTLTTSSNLLSSCITSTVPGATSSSSNAAPYLPGTLYTSSDPVTIIVRDMSSISASINRTSIYAPATSTIGGLLVEVGTKFGYEPDSFSLTLQNTRTAEQTELDRVDPSLTLADVGFIVDGISRNGLLLTDQQNSPPKRVGGEAAVNRDDDLALGASASPTSCGGEDSGMYSNSSTTGSRSKKSYWQQDQGSSIGASTSSAVTAPHHEYTNYTYGSVVSKQDTGYVGLVNQAMTCYLNSLLQTLFMTPEFRNALYRWEFKGTKDEGYKSIPYQLQKLFLLLQTADRSAVETTRLTRSFGWDSSEAWQQHDIQELCRVMFEALEQSFANTDQANLIDTLYQGKMKDYVKCLVCDKENARMDSFLDIPLPIRPFGSSTAYQSLEEALQAFVTPELLSGNNQYQCSNCNAMCDAHKGLKFNKYPYLLTIHLKRFDFDYQTFHRIKLNDKVTFPNILDLSQFLDNDSCFSLLSSMDATTTTAAAATASEAITATPGCLSTKSDSAASALDDAATDDSGSALDNEDSLVEYTPPLNTTQDEDEGIELSASDTEKTSLCHDSKATTQRKIKKNNIGDGVGTVETDGKCNDSSKYDSMPASIEDPCDGENIVSCTSDKSYQSDIVPGSCDKESLSADATSSSISEPFNKKADAYTTYQLFSIMIHSGSASGGHYYAYIRDFVSNDWFCFNDQSVSRISDDDIKRTYGSGSRSGSSFASSSNAYMLMYRQINEEMNMFPFTRDKFPKHIKELCNSLNEEEEQEREAREREKCTCVIKLYCHHPAAAHLTDQKLRVHKDATLEEAVKQAHQQLELYKVVPVDRCRLVKYEEYRDSLESSFEGLQDKPMSEVLGGVKSSYKFDLLMEVREKNQKFEVYQPGGLSFKVYNVILDGMGEIVGPYTVRGSRTMSVSELKVAIARTLDLKSEHMRIVMEGFYSKMVLLENNSSQLLNEGFYNSSKIFVEASGLEKANFFAGSLMASAIDCYQNTITLYCSIPDITPEILAELNISPYIEESSSTPLHQSKEEHQLSTVSEGGIQCTSASAISSTTIANPLEIVGTTIAISAAPASLTGVPTIVTASSSPSNSTFSSTSGSSLVSQKQSLTLPVPSSCNVSSAYSPSVPCVDAALPCPPAQHLASSSNSLVITGTAILNPALAAGGSMADSAVAVVGGGYLSDGDDDDGGDMCGGGGCSAFSSDQSTSEDSSLTSDSDRTLVGDPPDEDRLSDRCNSPDYRNVSSPEEGASASKVGGDVDEDWGTTGCSSAAVSQHLGSVTAVAQGACAASGDEALGTDIWAGRGDDERFVKRYFKAKMLTGGGVLEIRVDKRMTVAQLKLNLQPLLGVSVKHFKLYKKYIQEFECSRDGDQVKNLGDCGRLTVKLDRALQEGEYRGKLYLLDIRNLAEPYKFVVDYILRENDTVAQTKAAIVSEVNALGQLKLEVDRVRLRRKGWKNPQMVYLDHQVFGERDISLHNNWELSIEELEGPEPKTSEDFLLVFARRWRPSQYRLDAVQEVLLETEQTAQSLREKLSEVSGIPADCVQFSKCRGTFPHDMSVLDISSELDWMQQDGPLDDRSIGILDDGAMVYYRDSEEKLKELSESERSDLKAEENRRLNRELPYVAPAVPLTRPPREKGLKIYFGGADTAEK